MHRRICVHCPMTMKSHGRDSAGCILMRQSVKLFYIIVVVPAFMGHICNAQVLRLCNLGFNYTKGSKFESNLNTVFNSLVRHTSQTGFNTCVHGQIYGLLQCRGDATAAQCYNCSQQATSGIRQNCGNSVGARIWLDLCYLRYENYSFIGQLDTNGQYLYNIQKLSKPDVFNASLVSLLTNLSAEAVSSSTLYASGTTTTTGSLSQKIYGLVQCWRDISGRNCTTCLSKTINYMLASFGGAPGARGLMGSCTVRYETYSFFNSTVLPQPQPQPPAEAPPIIRTPPKHNITPSATDTGQINNADKSSNNIITIILGVLAALLLL